MSTYDRNGRALTVRVAGAAYVRFTSGSVCQNHTCRRPADVRRQRDVVVIE
jgi:hypothetical protein